MGIGSARWGENHRQENALERSRNQNDSFHSGSSLRERNYVREIIGLVLA